MEKEAKRYRSKTGRNETDGKKITVRMSTEEYNQVAQHAQSVGVSIATWLRERGLNQPLRVPGKLDVNAQREIWKQVAGLGRNCNQIAHTVNLLKKRGDLDQDAVADLSDRVAKLARVIEMAMSEIRSMVGRSG